MSVSKSVPAWEDAAPGGEFSTTASDLTSDSPLWMVTSEPILNDLFVRLQRLRVALMEHPSVHHKLQFSRSHLEQVRLAFANMILHGEQKLHCLCQLICDALVTPYQIQSVVIGEVETTKERFTITQGVLAEDLYTVTDIDLGSRQLKKLRIFDGQDWSQANLVANMVDYQPLEPNVYGIHKIISRIKAEQEVWNKVVDEIFGLDNIVVRDKQLRHLSRYVKDVFGIKIVVGSLDDIRRVHMALVELSWSERELAKFQVEPTLENRRLHFVEVKDYLMPHQQKQTGWEALKSVVRWSDKTMEIQIQTLSNFLHERELLTKESHTSFRAQREQVRNQVAEQIPLFRFYRDLLRWLFLNPQGPPPVYPGVTLSLVE
ncbi:MAG: hypothetical protein Fur0044_31120 [Anaerolineae bacterium]|nr:hypothetical protein [Anaerolineales bacterium]